MRTRIITLSLLLCVGFNPKKIFSQKSECLINKQAPNRSIIISSNVIYNYFTNKILVKIVNPDPEGRVPNSKQIVYYWNYKYYDTYTFDLSLQYNRFFGKRFSLSSGLRFDQLKSVRKTDHYIDSSAYLPDERNLSVSKYSLSLPVLGNFYLERFRFGLGFFAYFLSTSKSVYEYENNMERKFADMGCGLLFLAQESIAFKLYKSRGIYLQFGAIQRPKFWRHFGYYNFFTCGLSFEI